MDTETKASITEFREQTGRKEANAKVIEEFRANSGRVGGLFEGTPLLLLTHTGERSGQRHTTPLGYEEADGRIAIIAARPTGPSQWCRNLMANPDVHVEVGTKSYPAKARFVEGPEREEIWLRASAEYPSLLENQRLAGDRLLPVIVLAPVEES